MKILVDMNMSPMWVPLLEDVGFTAKHWSAIGSGHDPDSVIMSWAQEHGWIVLTNDLDFGSILAVTQAGGPSVIQARARDVSPESLAQIIITALRQHHDVLMQGALITVDESTLRSRILPLPK